MTYQDCEGAGDTAAMADDVVVGEAGKDVAGATEVGAQWCSYSDQNLILDPCLLLRCEYGRIVVIL